MALEWCNTLPLYGSRVVSSGLQLVDTNLWPSLVRACRISCQPLATVSSADLSTDPLLSPSANMDLVSAHQSPSSTLPCSSALTHRTWTSKDGSAGTFRNGAVMADVTDFASNTACSWMSVDLEPSISCLATWSVRGPCFSSWSTNLVSRPASIASVAANSSLENVDLVSVPLRRISRGAFLLRPAMPPSGVHSSLKRPTVSLATDLSTMPCITWVCAA